MLGHALCCWRTQHVPQMFSLSHHECGILAIPPKCRVSPPPEGSKQERCRWMTNADGQAHLSQILPTVGTAHKMFLELRTLLWRQDSFEILGHQFHDVPTGQPLRRCPVCRPFVSRWKKPSEPVLHVASLSASRVFIKVVLKCPPDFRPCLVKQDSSIRLGNAENVTDFEWRHARS